jgi:hypothetical protein
MSGVKWVDVDFATLEKILPILRAKYPAATVQGPHQLATEQDRLTLAMAAGAASVADDVSNEIKQRKRKD